MQNLPYLLFVGACIAALLFVLLDLLLDELEG